MNAASPFPLRSPLDAALNSLFRFILEDSLAEELYAASIAGLEYSMVDLAQRIAVRKDLKLLKTNKDYATTN
jgi:hypothetical protein